MIFVAYCDGRVRFEELGMLAFDDFFGWFVIVYVC